MEKSAYSALVSVPFKPGLKIRRKKNPRNPRPSVSHLIWPDQLHLPYWPQSSEKLTRSECTSLGDMMCTRAQPSTVLVTSTL